MKKYCIYYITTGPYVNYAESFFKSLKNFMPGSEKTVVWISDSFKNFDIPDITIKEVKILDMPWPLIALLKMHYIVDNKMDGYDGYFYFNANTEIIEMNAVTIDLLNEGLTSNKFITTKHVICIDDASNRNYAQTCFFGGNEEIFFDICKEVVNTVDEKLRNNIIPEWHDETALNEVIKGRDEIFFHHQFGLTLLKIEELNAFPNVFFIYTYGGNKKHGSY